MTMLSTKKVQLNGSMYAAPFADRYRPLSKGERDCLAESISERGVLHAVTTYYSQVFGLALIDGVNRCEIMKGTIPVVHLGELADDVAKRIADQLHLGRRNLDPTKAEQLRRERIVRIIEKRAEGQSLRTIAEEEKVSPEQVRRDLDKAGVTGGVTPEPEKVTGRDGKAYPAHQPTPPQDDTPDDIPNESESEPSEADPPPADAPRKSAPSYFRPGNNIDTDHRYADLLQKIATLGGLITKAIKEAETEEPGKSKLFDYLYGHGMVHARDFSFNGKHYGHRFIWFRGLRRLIKLAGMPGKPKTKDQLDVAYSAAMGDEDES